MNDYYPKIVVIKRNGADGPQFPLRTNECLFGRKPECDIRIQLPNVSLEHAIVRVANDNKIKVINLSSCNETLINGKPVSEVEIEHLDVLTISDRSFRFEFPLSVQKEAKSPKNQHCLSNTPQERKTPKMPTPRGSPRTPPTGESLKENIYMLRRHFVPLQEEEESLLASWVSDKTPFSSIDANTEPKEEGAYMQVVGERESGEKHKTRRHSKRVSFGPVLSPEQFDKNLPPATPVRRGAMPKRPSISGDNSILPLASSAKKRRSIAALPQAESIQEEGPLENEIPKTQKQQASQDLRTPERVEFAESKQLAQKSAMPTESKPTEIKEASPTGHRRSSLRLAAKSPSLPELQSGNEVQAQTSSPGCCMEEQEEDETILDSDDYTSDEEDALAKTDSEEEKSTDTELQVVENKLANPLQQEIESGVQLQPHKKMATPLRKEITNGVLLLQTKKKMATPLRKEITGGVRLRQTKKKMATPLRKELTSGVKLRQTKKKMATPLRKEITKGVQLRQTKNRMATPLRKEISSGVQLRQTKKKMATPLRKEITSGVQLRQTKKKMATPLRKEITSGVQLRQTKKKMATPLRKEITSGVQLRQTKKKMAALMQKEIISGVLLRQTKKKMATLLQKEITGGVQLRQTKKKMATPLRKEITSGVQLRQTKKMMATPLRKEITSGVQLRQTKKKMATPLRKEITSGVQLRQTKKKMATPLRKEITSGVQLRQIKKKMATPLRKEIISGVQLRQIKKKMATPLRKEIISGVQLRQTKKKMATPLQKEITGGVQLRQTKKKMATPLQDEIKRGSNLKKTKQTMPLELQIEIIKGKKLKSTKNSLSTPLSNGINLKKTKKSLPTPVRRQVKEGPALECVNKSLKRKRSEDGMSASESKKLKLSPSNGTSVTDEEPKVMQRRPALKTPLRKAIVAGTKLRRTCHRMGTPLQRQIHSKPTLRAIRRKSASTTVLKKSVPRKPTYAEIVKRPKKTSISRALTKTDVAPPTTFSDAVLPKPEASKNPPSKVPPKETCESTSLAEKEAPRRKSTNWMSSLERAASGETSTTSMEDLQGVAEMFISPPPSQFSAKKSSKKQTNWLSSLAKATNGPRRRAGAPVEDLIGLSEMFSTPPSVSRVTRSKVQKTPPSSREQELHLIAALKPTKTPSLRRSGKDSVAVTVATPVLQLENEDSITSQAMLEMVEPLKPSRTPSLRHSAEDAISLQVVSPVQLSRTPSLRSAKKQSSVVTTKSPELQLDLVPPLETSKTPSMRSANDVKTVLRKSFGNPRSDPKSLGLQGLQRLMKSPKPQPKRYSRKSEGLQGVARLLGTSDAKGETVTESPKLDGIKAMMQHTKESLASPNFVGLRVLMQTPKATETADPEEYFNSELFATVEADPSPENDSSTKSARRNRRGTKVSVPVIDLTSPETQAKAAKYKVNTETTTRTTRAKRNAPKGLPEPEPKKIRRTRASVNQESQGQPENCPNPKATLKKRNTRGKKNPAADTQTTPKPFVFKRTQLDPIIEIPTPMLSPDNPIMPIVTSSLTQIETKAPHEKRRTRSATATTTETKALAQSCLPDKSTQTEAKSSSRESSKVKVAENRSARKSKRGVGDIVDGVEKEVVKVVEPTKAKTRSTGKNQVQEAQDKELSSSVKIRATRSRSAEVPQAEKHIANATESATRRSRRGTKIVEENVSVLEETKSTRSTRSQGSYNHSDNSSSTRRTRNSHAEKIIVEEDVKAQQESTAKRPRAKRQLKEKTPNDPVLEETKSTRSTRRQDFHENDDNSSSTRRTRNNHPEKIIVKEDTKVEQDSSLKATRTKRELKGNAANESKKSRSATNTKPTQHEEQESENTLRATRGTKRKIRDDTTKSTAPETERTRSSARVQTRSSSRK